MSIPLVVWIGPIWTSSDPISLIAVLASISASGPQRSSRSRVINYYGLQDCFKHHYKLSVHDLHFHLGHPISLYKSSREAVQDRIEGNLHHTRATRSHRRYTLSLDSMFFCANRSAKSQVSSSSDELGWSSGRVCKLAGEVDALLLGRDVRLLHRDDYTVNDRHPVSASGLFRVHCSANSPHLT